MLCTNILPKHRRNHIWKTVYDLDLEIELYKLYWSIVIEVLFFENKTEDLYITRVKY